MRKKTILIIGVSSFVGGHLAKLLKDSFKVIGTYYNNYTFLEGVTSIRCNILDKGQIQTVLYLFKPDITIYCAGLTSLKDCQENPRLADALNTSGVYNIALFTERFGCKFVYISSSFIFPGGPQGYMENDGPMPICVYGNTVASSEFFIQKSCSNYLILRTCQLYGRSYLPNPRNWFEYLESSLLKGKKISVDDSIKIGFLDIELFSIILKALIMKNYTNRLFQVCSADTVTYYQFAKTMASKFDWDSGLIMKDSWDFPMEKNFFTLNNEIEEYNFKLETINIERAISQLMPSVEQSLEYTRKRYSNKLDKTNKKKSEGIQFI
jgi:dTDP-4-dehydrorhamnose reductase